MPNVLSPRFLLRGFGIFVLLSLSAFGAVLLYSNNLPAFVSAFGRIHWVWILVGVCLASLDWIGGGLRNWVVVRHVHPNPPLVGMILAGGMGAWAGYLTPLSSGAGPMMIYGMRRAGVPVPIAATSTLVTFIATILFFAIAGPLAIFFGAGKSLGSHGNLLGLSLYDLFLGSLSLFAGLGVMMIIIIFFPRLARDPIHKLAEKVSRRSTRVAARLESFRAGIDQAHESVVAFNSPKGWLAIFWAVVLSGPSHANKLLAGYVALRAVGLQAHFVDVLLLQTLITFLLYFAPTPGGSGIAELLSTTVMFYVPRELAPLYTLIWRCILSYFTLAFGFLVFSRWVHRGLRVPGLEDEVEVQVA